MIQSKRIKKKMSHQRDEKIKQKIELRYSKFSFGVEMDFTIMMDFT